MVPPVMAHGSIRERISSTRDSIRIESESDQPGRTRAGLPYRRVELSFSGTADGYVTLDGPIASSAPDRYSWMYDVPELCLPQEHLLLVDRLKPYPLPLTPQPEL